MATVRAIAADNEQITNTELIVTSALAASVTVFLPAIGDGTASTVTSDSSVTVYANGAGSVLVKDQYGHMIGLIQPGETSSFNAHVVTQGAAGVAAVSAWRLQPNVEALPLKATVEEQIVGAGAAIGFGATTPGAIATPAAVNRFVKLIASDGLPIYVPGWR
jgi:hypothetical protein